MRVSALMKDAAQRLAAEVTVGQTREAAEPVKFELRQLSCSMAAWADRVETLEGELTGLRARHPKPRSLTWIVDQVVSGAMQGVGLVAIVATLAWLVR